MPARAARRHAAAVGGDVAVKGVADEARQADGAGAAEPRTARPWPLGRRGHRGGGGGRGGVGVAGRGVLPGRLVRGRGAGAPAGDGDGGPAGSVGDDAGDATLGYAGSYTVTGRGGGTLTWLPSAGQVIRQGQVLYKTDNGSPVVLLYGSVPDWRALDGGRPARTCPSSITTWCGSVMPIVRISSRWAGITTRGRRRTAVERLEEDLGVSCPPGSLSLGPVVFEPGALRVSQVTGQPGRPGGGAGADGDLGPAGGDDQPGCLRAVGGEGGGQR